MKVVETTEGQTKLLVPKVSLELAEPPTTPVFFNPAAAMNRDITVAVTESATGSTFCDALSGVGARGIRVAKETRRKMAVTLVDFNAPALRLARRSARANGVARKCQAIHSESNSFLYSNFRRDEKFDFVDVDPFGTPVPFLQGAFSAVSDGGIVSVTATDTAVLCGVYPRVSMRRYGARTVNNSFHHETAVRVLVGWCRKVAGSLDIGVSPLLSHVTRHYVRVYVRAHVGATKADASLESEGYVVECTKCNNCGSGKSPSLLCERCGGKVMLAGPLWVGDLVDEALVKKAMAVSEEHGFASAAKTLGPLLGLNGFAPHSYSLEQACSRLRVASVSPERVAEILADRGFASHAQPFEKTGIKTDAPYEELESAVKEA